MKILPAMFFLKYVLLGETEHGNKANADSYEYHIFTNVDVTNHKSLSKFIILLAFEFQNQYRFPNIEIVSRLCEQQIKNPNTMSIIETFDLIQQAIRFIANMQNFLGLSKEEFEILYMYAERANRNKKSQSKFDDSSEKNKKNCLKHGALFNEEYKNFLKTDFCYYVFTQKILHETSKGNQACVMNFVLMSSACLIANMLSKLIDKGYCVPCILTDFYVRCISSVNKTKNTSFSVSPQTPIQNNFFLYYYCLKNKKVTAFFEKNANTCTYPDLEKSNPNKYDKHPNNASIMLFSYDPSYGLDADDNNATQSKKDFQIREQETIDEMINSLISIRAKQPIVHAIFVDERAEVYESNIITYVSSSRERVFTHEEIKAFTACFSDLKEYSIKKLNEYMQDGETNAPIVDPNFKDNEVSKNLSTIRSSIDNCLMGHQNHLLNHKKFWNDFRNKNAKLLEKNTIDSSSRNEVTILTERSLIYQDDNYVENIVIILDGFVQRYKENLSNPEFHNLMIEYVLEKNTEIIIKKVNTHLCNLKIKADSLIDYLKFLIDVSNVTLKHFNCLMLEKHNILRCLTKFDINYNNNKEIFSKIIKTCNMSEEEQLKNQNFIMDRATFFQQIFRIIIEDIITSKINDTPDDYEIYKFYSFYTCEELIKNKINSKIIYMQIQTKTKDYKFSESILQEINSNQCKNFCLVFKADFYGFYINEWFYNKKKLDAKKFLELAKSNFYITYEDEEFQTDIIFKPNGKTIKFMKHVNFIKSEHLLEKQSAVDHDVFVENFIYNFNNIQADCLKSIISLLSSRKTEKDE